MKRIAFIGLGVMGKPMSKNIVKGGFPTTVFDIDDTSTHELRDCGATVANSAKECARHADIVITMLPVGSIVKEVLYAEDGILAGIQPNALMIDMSTILPSDTDEIADKVIQHGARFMDAPVGRQSIHAEQGKLLIMIGGSHENVAEATPVLSTMGDTLEHCGDIGMGSRMKVVNNYMSITINSTTSETLVLAEKSGLDVAVALKVMLGTVAGNGHMGSTYPAKVLQGDTTPGFPVDLASKDLDLALTTAQQLNLSLDTGKVAQQQYQEAQKQNCGRNDWTVLYQLARAKANLKKST